MPPALGRYGAYSPETTAVCPFASFEHRDSSLGRQDLGKAQRGLLDTC